MVSVIVPVYNTEEYLPQCLDSICGQTLKDLEIILVDDGSTDRSGEICDGYAAKDNRIVVIHKENGGLVSARQAGLRVARGEYVGYVDSDDWIDAAMYEDMLSAALRENADIVISSGYYRETEERGTSFTEVMRIPEGVYKKGDGSIDILYKNMIYAENYGSRGIDGTLWDKLFRKDLLWKYQFRVDPQIYECEDGPCTYCCCVDADTIVVVGGIYCHYRARSSSMTHVSNDDYFKSITLYYQQVKPVFQAHPSRQVLMDILKHDMLDLFVQGINTKFGLGFGTVVPRFLPPHTFQQQYHGRKIALYGAGDVGQSYRRLFQLAEAVEIAAWVDRQWERYRADGLSTEPVSVLAERDYDVILIAVLSAEVAERIRADLLKMGIPAEKIYYGKPRNLMQTV